MPSDPRTKRKSRAIFPFLKLPAELRIAIYEACFIVPAEIDITPPSIMTPSPVPGAFLRTCKQIYAEAHAILYTKNIFRIGDELHHATAGITWLTMIGSEKAKLLRGVAVEIRSLNAQADLSAFLGFLSELRKYATGLKKLSVWSGQRTYHWDRLLAQELSEFWMLDTLTVGAEYLLWTPQHFIRLQDEYGVKVDLVPWGAPAWIERRTNMARWKERASRAQLERRIVEWQTRKERELVEWGYDRIGDWRDVCPCNQCEGQRRTLRSVSQRIGQDRIEMESHESSRFDCWCNDCIWVRDYGTPEQQAMNCFDLHEWASNGGIDDASNLQNADRPRSYESQSEEREPEEVAAPLPIRPNQYFQGQGTDGVSYQRAQPEPKAFASTIKRSSKRTSNKGSMLRRENRKWYGKSPIKSAPFE